MPARLAGAARRPAQCHQGRQRWEFWWWLSCHLCPDHKGGANELDDSGPAAGDEPVGVGVGVFVGVDVGVDVGVFVGVGVGVGLVPVGVDTCAGDGPESAGTGDDDAPAGVGLSDLVGDGPAEQAGAFAFVLV